MKSIHDNEIVKVFEQLKELRVEIWLSEQGWMQYEELLLGSENENTG